MERKKRIKPGEETMGFDEYSNKELDTPGKKKFKPRLKRKR